MLRGRENFLSLARANQNKLSVEGRAETLEVHIDGKLAHMWNRLSITITPKDGSAPFTKAGDTMSLLRKEPDGRWVLVRDVNLLPP
jgi:ketosteroid isomerase-like protein